MCSAQKDYTAKGWGWGASASTLNAHITLKTALYQIWKRGAQGPETRRGSTMPIGRVSGVLEGFWYVGAAGLWLLRGCCGVAAGAIFSAFGCCLALPNNGQRCAQLLCSEQIRKGHLNGSPTQQLFAYAIYDPSQLRDTNIGTVFVLAKYIK